MFPYPYSQDQSSLLVGLINNSNPGLQVAPLTVAQLRAMVPTAITPVPPAIQDTSTRLMVKQGTRYVGSQTVTYRRINLANLFRGVNVDGNGITTLVLQQYQNATSLTAAQIATELNATYGLQLTAADLVGTGTPTSTTVGVVGTAISLVIASTSLCYAPGTTGVKLAWLRPKVPLSSVIAGSPGVLAGRQYPGGNVFPTDGSRKPQGEFFLYGFDASSLTSAIGTLANTGLSADFTTVAFATILNVMQQARPDLNFTSANASTQGGLNTCQWVKVTLPTVNAPLGNAVKFTNALLIVAPTNGNGWFQGSIYLHYNVASTPGVPTAEGLYLDSATEQMTLLKAAGAAAIGVKDAATGYTQTAIRATVAGDNVTQNTKARITAASGNTTYGGYEDVVYNRLDLGALANFSPYQLAVQPNVSVMTVLSKIRDQFGIQLTAADISDVQTQSNSDGSLTTVTLTALANSPGWIGTVTLTFLGLPNIATAFSSAYLGGF